MSEELDERADEDLAAVRAALNPPSEAVSRIVSRALQRGRRNRAPRAIVAGCVIATLAIAAALTFHFRAKADASIRMGNAGSVVFVDTGAGASWAVCGSRRAGSTSIVITKGESR